MSKGLFITVEGIEGAGKTTALQYIRDYFQNANKEMIVTREPGGTPVAEEIRNILLNANTKEQILPETELFLIFAGRAQHVHHVIAPALAAGKCVISDRFVDASYAYQGGGRGINMGCIAPLEQWIVGQYKPDLTLLLDVKPELGLARAKHRGPQDRIEQEKLDFFERVRDTYLARAKAEPNRIRIVDGSQSLEQVKSQIHHFLDELISATHES